MGVLQMAESEHSGNSKSKDQEKPRKPSMESSQSPKAAQPSCLREAFIRIFPKRSEPNNKTEEDPPNNQSTEDHEGGRGKKRKVSGGIFRLPCLRPAETTGNDIQDKTGEQSNDVFQEEELKPYSKASFLRKIRCYRLMRERDASEKDKVIEMQQRKQENAEVQQHQETVIEQNEEGLQNRNLDEGVERKDKDTSRQECNGKRVRESGNNVQGRNFRVEHVMEQECNTEKRPKSVEDTTQGQESMDKDEAEKKTCDETSVLLEGEVQSIDDKNLAEQKSPLEKVENVELKFDGDQEESKTDQKNDTEKVVVSDNALPNNVTPPEKHPEQDMSIQDETVMEEDVQKEESHDNNNIITNTHESDGTMDEKAPEKSHQDELGDKGHGEKVGKVGNNFSGHCLKEDTRLCLSDAQMDEKELEDKDKMEQDNKDMIEHDHKDMVEQDHKDMMEQDHKDMIEQGHKDTMKQDHKDMMEQDHKGDVTENLENNERHKEKEDHGETGGDQENSLDSQVENTMEEILQDEDIVKDTQAQTLVEIKENTSGVSLDDQDEPNQGLTKTIPNQESVTCQLQDKQLLISTPNNDISSDEAQTQVQDPKKIQKCVNIEEEGIGCKNKDLGTLRVEVKDMVECMVQEASDRLCHYTQESDGTG